MLVFTWCKITKKSCVRPIKAHSLITERCTPVRTRIMQGECGRHGVLGGGLADQDVLTAITTTHPTWFGTIPCGWNKQLCRYHQRKLSGALGRSHAKYWNATAQQCLGNGWSVVHANCDHKATFNRLSSIGAESTPTLSRTSPRGTCAYRHVDVAILTAVTSKKPAKETVDMHPGELVMCANAYLASRMDALFHVGSKACLPEK